MGKLLLLLSLRQITHVAQFCINARLCTCCPQRLQCLQTFFSNPEEGSDVLDQSRSAGTCTSSVEVMEEFHSRERNLNFPINH